MCLSPSPQAVVLGLLSLCTIGCAFASTSVCSAAELLVSDRATHRVLAFDATTGDFSRVVVGQDGANLFSPAAMAIGFGGDLFVASQGTGKVLRYNSVTGAPKGSTPGSPVFLDLGLPTGPAGLLYDSANDRLFVSLLGNADSTIVKIFDSTGGDKVTINAGPAAGRTGMALDGSGNLYVNSFNEDGFGPGESGAVLKFSGPDFSTMTTLIAGDGDFDPQEPIIAGMNGLALDGNDNLYAASLFGQQVIKLTTGGVVTGVISAQNPPNPSNPPTAYPSGLLIDGSTLLVSTLGNNNPADPIYGEFTFPGSVQKFDLNGNFLGVLISDGPQNDGTFQPTSMLLVADPVPGDFDGDGDVDGADFVIWQTNFPSAEGETLASGDADGDGDVDGADFVIWQTNFPTAPSPATASVPEPMALMLIAMGFAGIMGMRQITMSRVGESV